MRRIFVSTFVAVPMLLASAACVHGQPEQASSATMADADHAETFAFVQTNCGGCHAVEGDNLSSNPQAPRFIDIANREWLTRKSLATWLADAHNYPEMMEVDLAPEQVDAVAGYMLTLRSEDYQRLPD